MNKKSVLLFDLDGTIINSQEGITKSAQHALRAFNINIEDPSELKHFIGPPLRDTFSGTYGLNEKDSTWAIEVYRKFFAENSMRQYELYSGISDLIKDLYTAGKTLLIATTKAQDIAVEMLTESGLSQYFKFIAGATFDGSRSAKADVIRYALKNFEPTPKDNLLMIGDKSHDVLGAHKIGIHCVGVMYGFGSHKELTDANADFIVNTVAELRDLILK